MTPEELSVIATMYRGSPTAIGSTVNRLLAHIATLEGFKREARGQPKGVHPMTTPHAKTAEEVAKAIVAKHLDPTCQDAATIERAIAAAIREAESRGREEGGRTALLVRGFMDKAPPSHILDDAGNVRRDRLNEMREVRGWLSSALDRMELADVTRLPWLAAALTNSYQQLDAFIGEREAALSAKDAQGAKHE